VQSQEQRRGAEARSKGVKVGENTEARGRGKRASHQIKVNRESRAESRVKSRESTQSAQVAQRTQTEHKAAATQSTASHNHSITWAHGSTSTVSGSPPVPRSDSKLNMALPCRDLPRSVREGGREWRRRLVRERCERVSDHLDVGRFLR
jgi:hypothetical protein